MRKLALLVAFAVAASAPSVAFAAKKRADKSPETLETLNKDTVKAIHDFFIWPAATEAPKAKVKKAKAKKA
jgi:hypothetical protein